jgi:rRNA-processing protein FCF1
MSRLHDSTAPKHFMNTHANFPGAKAIPVITECVMGELEKLGPRYRIALRIARDERWVYLVLHGSKSGTNEGTGALEVRS